MTDNNHSITPPHELVREWAKSCSPYDVPADHIASQAARWGYEQRGAVNEAELQKARDAELEACCKWMRQSYQDGFTADMLRSARRPKPKSQAEEALEALADAMIMGHIITTSSAAPTIRAALERLRELEGNQ